MIPFDNAVHSGEIDGIPFWVIEAPVEGALNGYVKFPKRPVVEDGYDGILTYVPVHGGITYAAEDEDGGMVYGFDSLHCDSAQFPRTDPSWVEGECRKMIVGIRKAAEVEKKYLRCVSIGGKAKHADAVRSCCGDPPPFNFGELINIMSGKV